MRFSAPVKKHWLGSFSIVLPPSGLRGFVPVVRDRWEQGRPGGPGARDPRAYIYIYIHTHLGFSCQGLADGAQTDAGAPELRGGRMFPVVSSFKGGV